jgi:alpha-1,4-digalacturonate transport system substrate-binding protein
MEYLASEDVLKEFYGRTLFVPGHLGLSAKGIDYPSASPLAKAALDVFTGEVKDITPLAYKVKTYPYNQLLFNAAISRLGQAISGEISLDEAYKRIDSDAKQQIAERKKK